tara:strand:+ start:21394 stop:21555 length:162 start_codon:yes stop_codon:yes gene_type:complete
MKKDHCVACDAPTIYSELDHVDMRLCYVEGAGQLCMDCYQKIYPEGLVTIDEN